MSARKGILAREKFISLDVSGVLPADEEAFLVGSIFCARLKQNPPVS
jgi:hypothetical protein